MQSSYQGPERRKSRSDHANVALRHQLEHVALQRQIDSLVLADAEGRLWAASDEVGDCSHAVRAAATLPRDKHGFIELVPNLDPVIVMCLRLRQGELFLAARSSGEAAGRSRRGLIEAALGVERILRTLSN